MREEPTVSVPILPTEDHPEIQPSKTHPELSCRERVSIAHGHMCRGHVPEEMAVPRAETVQYPARVSSALPAARRIVGRRRCCDICDMSVERNHSSSVHSVLSALLRRTVSRITSVCVIHRISLFSCQAYRLDTNVTSRSKVRSRIYLV